MNEHFDIAVVGGGLAGSVAALAAVSEGWRVAFVAPEPPGPDRRTTALLSDSVSLLERLGVWEEIRAESAALSTMRILDGTRRLLRAPPVTFHASEIGLIAFGHNTPNAPLLEALRRRLADHDRLVRFVSPFVESRQQGEAIALTIQDGTALTADALIAADGRKSRARACAGISVREWSYKQTAMVMNFTHKLPHHNISTEFHTEAGPFTQVPLPGDRSSLVWAVDPGEVDRIMALPRAALDREVEERMSSLLGAVEVEEGFQAYPMSGLIAGHFASGRTFLVGEAGHAFPPIGAQGLNLGLRDVEAVMRTIREAGGPSGAKAAALAYDHGRRLDVSSRTAGVDLLNRTLLSGFLPAQLLRAGGLALLASVKPLKVLAMREGMTPGWRRPSLTRTVGEALREQVGRQRSRRYQP